MAWMVEHLADVRSDLSRFHRVDELEDMRADRFVEYAARLAIYDGAVALRARREAEPSELPVMRVEASNPTPDDLARLYPAAPAAGQMVPMFEHTVV